MNAPRQRQQQRRSAWSREPNFVIAILLCGVISIILDLVGVRVIHLSRSIIYPIIIIADTAILVNAAFKVSAANKRAEEARREAYRQKFEADLEAIKAWDKSRKSKNTKKGKM